MEIIKINCDKIKISLSQYDMDILHINCDMLDGIDPEGKKAFNKILDEAKLQCGFSTDGKRIFVQIFPSKDGGCEIFISRLNDAPVKKYSVGRKRKNICYRFNEINDLLMFCRAAQKKRNNIVSSFYYDEKQNKYYICLDKDIPIASEFYGKKCIVNTDAYLKEHCRFITDNALEKLGNI